MLKKSKCFFFIIVMCTVQIFFYRILARMPGYRLKASPQIVNGFRVSTENYPFLAALVTAKYQFIDDQIDMKIHLFCSGSILAPKLILTAAHCIENNRSLAVVVGSDNFTTAIYLHEVLLKVPHPLFDRATRLNDIGLLILCNSLSWNKHVQPVVLNKRDLEYTFGMGIGYGSITPGKINITGSPYAGFFYDATPWCVRFLQRYNFSFHYGREYCGKPGPNENIRLGQGDSGGPYIAPAYGQLMQFGVISSQIFKSSGFTVFAFTNVTFYLRWLDYFCENECRIS